MTVTAEETRRQKLTIAMAQIDKEFGEGSIMRLGSDSLHPWESFSTGAATLDNALGIGGLPRGRMVEIYGPESSGKSTVALSVIAEAQREGVECAFIDAEHALDPGYAHEVGVNLDDVLISQPDTGEQALGVVQRLVDTGCVGVIVVDSVAALTPKAELDGDMGQSHVGLQSRLMSQAMRKLNSGVSKTGTLLIFINQIREKVGVMFGSPETTPGGRALKFYSSVRLDLRKIESLKDKSDGSIRGIRVKGKVVKNKMSPPFRISEFNIIYGHGVDRAGSIIELGVEKEVVKKSGAWYSYGDTQLGQGVEGAKSFLMDNPELFDKIKEELFGSKQEGEDQ